MSETIYSVGIDIGTSTTQLVISQLTLENRATPFSVPKVNISDRQVCYRSDIHFTPLKSDTVIDAQGVRDIVAEEYRKSGFARGQISTGAVIITGETARKENARQVLERLAGFAGDFVVATAGPDLESILAARGAGADTYARTGRTGVLNFDIGGGTSNLALYQGEELVRTGCLDIGGRLVKLDRDGRVTYASPGLRRVAAAPAVGTRVTPEALTPLVEHMAQALAQAAGLTPRTELLDGYLTQGTRWIPPQGAVVCSFSGGVADCLFGDESDWLAYGDIGVLLGRAIRDCPAFQGARLRRGEETIRATVVGAGSHATDISGSTIFYRTITFPMKNLPILKLTAAEEGGSAQEIAHAIGAKLGWFADQGGLSQIALGLRGEQNPGYGRVRALAQGVAAGLAPLGRAGFSTVVVVEHDMAKVLGQAMAPLCGAPLLCLDGVGVENGDYIDIGAPLADGAVLPVIIKTLVFQPPQGGRQGGT